MKKVSILDVCKLNDQTVKEFTGTKEYIATGGIEKDKIVSSTSVSFEEKPSRANREVEIGDILLAKMKDTDKVLLINEDNKNYIYSTGFFTIKPDTNIVNTKYIYHVLKSEYFQGEKNKLAKGATQKALNNAGLKKIKIPIPSKIEQEKIVNALEKVESTLSKRQQQIEALSALKQNIFLDMFGDPRINNKKFPVRPFEHFAKIDTNLINNFKGIEDLPHISVGEIERDTGKILEYKTIEESNIKSGKHPFDSRHIIYSKIRPYLNKVALPNFKGVCSSDAYPILINEENTNREFFAFLLRSNAFLEYIETVSSRTNIPKANQKQLYAFKGICPPIELQNKFLNMVQSIDKKQLLIENSLSLLKRLYKTLLHKSFNGELFKDNIKV